MLYDALINSEKLIQCLENESQWYLNYGCLSVNKVLLGSLTGVYQKTRWSKQSWPLMQSGNIFDAKNKVSNCHCLQKHFLYHWAYKESTLTILPWGPIVYAATSLVNFKSCQVFAWEVGLISTKCQKNVCLPQWTNIYSWSKLEKQ